MTSKGVQPTKASHHYFISPKTTLPEITIKVTLISLVLTIVLAAANAYLGLKVGLTITGSIPAAIIAMGLLRLFKHYNVLENNIAQTAASAGDTLAAGIIFTLPATLIIGAWTDIAYWPTVMIGLLGGVLGVLFAVPLRRVLLDDPNLHFPEGVAIGEVLKHTAGGDTTGLGTLVKGSLFGAIISVAQIGFKLIADGLSYWVKIGSSLCGIGLGFSPALIGAGFIVGFGVSFSILIGVILGWIIGVPIISAHQGVPDLLHDNTQIAYYYWMHYIRYIGIGTMIVGSASAIICLFKPMFRGIRASIGAMSQHDDSILRTERDIPFNQVLIGSVVITLAIFVMIYLFAQHNMPEFSLTQHIIFAAISALLIYGLGFLVAAICGYFAGLVGSSISPISCMILIATISVSLVLLVLASVWHLPKTQLASFAVLAVLINAVIAAVAAISNDTIQDLKAGQIIGATPWKQQVMLFFGVAVAAFVLPFIIKLLYHAYGIAGVFPRPDMDPSQMLLAPQATLIATVTKGVFTLSLPWTLLGIGMAIGLLVIVLDKWLKPRGLHLHILGVGTGIYLPFSATVPLIIGGFTAGFVGYVYRKRKAALALADDSDHTVKQTGLLAGCGLVAGASISGVLLAIPFAMFGSSDVLRLVGPGFGPYASVLSVLTTIALVYWIYRVTLSSVFNKKPY